MAEPTCFKRLSLSLECDKPAPSVSENSLERNDSELLDKMGVERLVNSSPCADWLIVVCHSNIGDTLITNFGEMCTYFLSARAFLVPPGVLGSYQVSSSRSTGGFEGTLSPKINIFFK